jgi:Fe-S-cluster-containing dehydrogenase component
MPAKSFDEPISSAFSGGNNRVARYGMVMDVTRCNGCYNCFLACKDEYCGNDHLPYSVSQPMTGHYWMKIIEKERGRFPRVKMAYLAVPCMHCDNATCVKMSRDGAVYKRSDGIVIIDPEKAKGQKEILSSCPYRVIYWNEQKQVPQKCTLCAHLLDQGYKEPRCVEACPTGALIFGDLDNPDSEVSRLIASGEAESLHPEYGLGDKVKFRGLPGRFIAGSVVFGDTDECAESVSVTLIGEGEKQTIQTNNYGDFEFENLPADKVFTVIVEAPGYKTQRFEVKTTVDVYLGDIFLQRSRTNKKQK